MYVCMPMYINLYNLHILCKVTINFSPDPSCLSKHVNERVHSIYHIGVSNERQYNYDCHPHFRLINNLFCFVFKTKTVKA